ncbi:hypothetical protein M9Y10_042117 [Tritrichomonas musculus]|uniref:Myb-like DNA-binding domain containing protein n=1 Tax=Tritrichomonas musculus TaxID=1915356 RepID=A0ABR2K6W9_9EUKA
MQLNKSTSPKAYRKKYYRKLFSFEEDAKLMVLVEKFKDNWKKIASEMKNRSVRQCKERYFHYLAPDIKREDWSHEEDLILLSSVEKYGKKWKSFEVLLNGRTEIDIRNRFNVISRKIAKKIRKESLSFNILKENSYCIFRNNSKNDQKLIKEKECSSESLNKIQSNSIEIKENEERNQGLNQDIDEFNIFADKNFGSDISDNSFEEYMSEFCF